MSAVKIIRLFPRYLLLFLLGCKLASAQAPPPLCGTTDSVNEAMLHTYTQKIDLSQARVGEQEYLEYRLGLDINYQTYLLYGGDTTKLKRIAYAFIEKASQIFERDVRIKLTVSSILIWKQPEPYALDTDIDYYSNVLTFWNMNRHEERDAVVSLSVRSGWFYGGLRMCTSNLPGPGNPDLAVDILAHELGHTLGSPHTHSCNWPGGPIDYCELVEGSDNSCQSTFKEYTNGTLMSYCRSLMVFHPLCQNIMRAQAEGKVRTDFMLRPLSGMLHAEALTMAKATPNGGSNLPTFQWPATQGAHRFQIQVAQDATFSNLLADTLVGQTIYQSTGLGQGQYWARYRIRNASGVSTWSSSLAFHVQPFSSNTEAPLMNHLFLSNKGQVSGGFNRYEEADRYQIMIINQNNPKQYFIYDYNNHTGRKQNFSVPLNMPLYGWYAIQLRLGNDREWSQWSTSTVLNTPWNGSFWDGNMLTGNTSTPLIATTLFQPALQRGLQQSLEISTDRDFKNLIYSDSVAINKVHDWYTNKVLFEPVLSEHTTYYARTRMLFTPTSYTEWDSTSFVTGWKDQRFQYLGTIATNPLPTSSFGPDFSPCYFYKTAGKLYIYTNNMGYYSTANLQDWKPVTVRSTKGKSPDYLRKFVATDSADEYTVDQNYVLTQQAGGVFRSYPSPGGIYSNRLSPAVVVEGQGLFFQSSTQGIIRFHEGHWQFYGKNILTSDHALLVAKSENSVWAVMEGGTVWKFSAGQWEQKPSLNQWRSMKGLTFDTSGQAYAYGDWGASKLREGQQGWEEIPNLAAYPIQKLIFDSKENIWIASYRFEGNNVRDYALVKVSDGRVTAYHDGLAFFREPFDITYFRDKLLILTSGGEIHQFDEDRIQRFTASTSYCGGEQLPIVFTSNSTLPNDANLHLELVTEPVNSQATLGGIDRETIPLSPTRTRAGQLIFLLPTEVEKGNYRIRTVLDNPDVKSPESIVFRISKAPVSEVSVSEQSNSSTKLLTIPLPENHYQWIWNGQDMAGETSAQLHALQDGTYMLRSTNTDGCTSLSTAIIVAMEYPTTTTLLQNFPNPVKTTAKIEFYTPKLQSIKLELMDTKGAIIKSLNEALFEKGWHSVLLDAHNLSSGIYLYRLSAENYQKTLKLIKE